MVLGAVEFKIPRLGCGGAVTEDELLDTGRGLSIVEGERGVRKCVTR